MSEFLSKLIERHLTSPNLVVPRIRSRFETEDAGLAKSLPIDGSAIAEARVEKPDRMDRVSENDAVGSTVTRIEPPGIDVQVNSPEIPVTPVGPKVDHSERGRDLVRAHVTHSVAADVDPPEREHRYGSPVMRNQDSQPVKPQTAEPTHKEGDAVPYPVFHMQSTVETDSQPTLPEDLHETLPGTIPTVETHAHASETVFGIEGDLDQRINDMLARLKDHQTPRPAEQAEARVLGRSIGDEADNPVASENDRTARPPLIAPLSDEYENSSASVADQEPYAAVSDDRDTFRDGLLAPPDGLADMQAEFNRRWNELNRSSEPDPVVNVTIGRVEVRAVQADIPQKERRQRKPKPSGVMSLEEYLNQRERRG